MELDLQNLTGSGWVASLSTRVQDIAPAILWLGGAIIAAVLLHALLYRIIFARLESRYGVSAMLLRRARRPVRLSLVLVALLVALQRVNLPFGWDAATQHIALTMLITLIGWTLIVLTSYFSDRYTSRFRFDTDDNLVARKHVTQLRVFRRAINIIIGLLTAGTVLLTFDGVREYGVSLFASAGAAGLVLGLAARPVLANLIAGIQIAITQPIRLEDVVIVEGEWGWIEEIFATFVVVRIWDRRRLVVPLAYFIEQPFQNWTRESASIIGAVTWELDYTAPVEEMRDKLDDLLHESDLWDRDVANLQVIEAARDTITIRALMSARTSPKAWDLRCEIREKMLRWLRGAHPEALPRQRTELRIRSDSDAEDKLASAS